MAKRRKIGKKRKTTRRRKMGALSMTANSPLVKYGSVGAGYLLADKIDAALLKATGGKVDAKIVAGIQTGLGLFLFLGKGPDSMLKSVAGGVLLGSGVKSALKAFGVINGFSNVPVISGYRDLPVIGYRPASGMLGGYNVPASGSSVMGSFDNGSGINQVDR